MENDVQPEFSSHSRCIPPSFDCERVRGKRIPYIDVEPWMRRADKGLQSFAGVSRCWPRAARSLSCSRRRSRRSWWRSSTTTCRMAALAG